MSIETGERLTLDEMIEKYPNQWLFIVSPEIDSDTSELVSGIVTARSDLRDDIYRELRTLKGGAVIRYTGKIPKLYSLLWKAEAQSKKRKISDKAAPLLTLAGTLECDEDNISDRHDELIGDGLLTELCGHASETTNIFSNFKLTLS